MFSKNLSFPVGLELLIANDHKPEKTAEISRCHCRFPPKMSLPRSGKCHITVRHQYGMSALISQTSFHGETSGGIMKCQQFSEVKFSLPLFYLYYSTSLAHLHNQERNDLKPIHLQTLTSYFFVVVYISRQLNQLTSLFFSQGCWRCWALVFRSWKSSCCWRPWKGLLQTVTWTHSCLSSFLA